MRLTSVLLALSLSAATLPAIAQSTIGDPTPMLGDQARAIAANTALGGAGQGKPSAQEMARREQHKAEMKACQDNYRANTRSGSPQRKTAREACESKFKAQRATWYAKK
jgi:hypothetical protein